MMFVHLDPHNLFLPTINPEYLLILHLTFVGLVMLSVATHSRIL